MKPGIYYLYEYRNNTKIRNVGFIKFTESYTLQICARGIAVFSSNTVLLSALYMNNKQFHCFPAISVSCEDHAISCRIQLPENVFAPPHTLDSICGFLLELSGDTQLAAVPPEISFSPNLIVPAADTTADTGDVIKANILDETDILDDTDSLTETACSAEAETSTEPDAQTEVNAHADEDSTLNVSAPADRKVRQIQRSDLSILPRCQWHLANNSFLLHGYHNYNHLLLIEEDGHLILGVPGIYDKREARAAELFGFPVFSDSYTEQMGLNNDELSPYSPLGYWCRKI